ncbi:maleylpyruvate isomerase family mycothiol-dependent enzyme [Mycolicibacter sp. MYC123]|uniref:Maleylpyruvate isomerase family mycothiol-dependent enzyme n=1 Tax=[Mycobacterium] zoologicum TaxID=2872311 RepID=A0ABU5YRI2_9MYCO|nr:MULTISPECIES: maleylpyruvate isomerase family mycothiol-dependent enzyme [unclassified Mycolicibacter]MEB3052500.1 maleylpyruvate isomerase family mycothiol-dependent enzyme [Mycolicibacter sp. MYC123]MEB3063182.1 maleylpyruvate isomerase family mycothiol-dependent enzyme [Mycolicibacter sp. MYC101]
MLDVTYRNARARIAALAAGLTDTQLATPVPATPSWTVHELLAHLAGGAADAAANRLDGAPGASWTARHVAERRTRPVAELIAEWEADAPAVEAALVGQKFDGPNLAADAICHEADLHEALGLARTDREHWQPLLDVMGRLPGRRLRDTATLLISDELGQQWRCGTGETVITLRADGYELMRALFSRRSRRQIAAWDWSPEPSEQLVDGFGAFGHRDDDQPIPAA